MRCRVASGLLRKMAHGALSPGEQAPLQGHLGVCARCAREARVLEATRRLLGAFVEGEGPSPAFCQRPWGKLAETTDAFAVSARHLIPAAAVMAVLLGGLTYLLRPLEPTGGAPGASLDRFLESSWVVPEEVALLSGSATLTQDDVLALVLARGRGVPAQ